MMPVVEWFLIGSGIVFWILVAIIGFFCWRTRNDPPPVPYTSF